VPPEKRRLETEWSFPTTNVTAVRRGPRTTVPAKLPNGLDVASRLVGFEGSCDVALRPSKGFRIVREADLPSGAGTWEGSTVDPPSDYTFVDVRAVELKVGENDFIYGFMYRTRSVAKGVNASDHLWLEYRIVPHGNFTVLEVDWNIAAAAQWDVVTSGRIMYVFVEGREVVSIEIEDTSVSPAAGAGEQYPAGAWGLNMGPADTKILGGEQGAFAPGPGQRPVWSTTVSNSIAGLDPAFLDLSAGETAFGSLRLVGQNTTEWPDTFVWLGGTAFFQQNEDIDRIAVRTPGFGAFVPGGYGFAYQLISTKTGRRSQITDLLGIDTTAFDDPAKDDLFAVNILYNTQKFNAVAFYRSVENPNDIPVLSISQLFLDRVFDLVDSKSAAGAGDALETDEQHSTVFFEASDNRITSHMGFTDSDTYDEEVPRGGAALLFDGTMLVSKIVPPPASTTPEETQDPEDFNQSLGVMRWSSLRTQSVELFPPENIFVPSIPTSEIIRFGRVGDTILGFAREKVYLIRRQGFILDNPKEIHIGFGITGDRAMTVVGPIVYFLTHKGLKVADSTGGLQDVAEINTIIIDEWRGQLGNVKLVYDAFAGLIMVHNPDLEKMVCLWITSGKITEFFDANFVAATEGLFTRDISDPESPFVDRAFLLQTSGVGTSALGRVYAYDFERAKARVTFLEVTGDVRLDVGSVASNVVTTSGGTPGTDIVGTTMYVLETTPIEDIGRKSKITAVSGQDVTVENGSLFKTNDRVGISPVFCSVVTPPISVQDEGGFVFGRRDFMQQKTIEAVGAAFTRVEGAATSDGTTDAKFQGVYFRGDDEAAFATSVPQLKNMDKFRSIVDGSSQYDAAFKGSNVETNIGGRLGIAHGAPSIGLQTFCPEADYRLLMLRVKGKIEATQRDKRPEP